MAKKEAREGHSVVSSELTTWISRQIAAFAGNEEQPEGIRLLVRRHGVLPILIDWEAFWGITPTGEILLIDTEHQGGAVPEEDPRIRRVALYRGSRTYPHLACLIAAKPEDAVECPSCLGTGQIPLPGVDPNLIICYCGGLGWLLPGELNALRA